MTKKEIQKRLLESLELTVGDKIKVTQESYVHTNKVFVIREPEDDCDEYYLELENSPKDEKYLLSILVDKNWEKVEEKEKLGEMRCKDIECTACPLYLLNCGQGSTLFECFESCKKRFEECKKESEFIEYVKLDWDAIKDKLNKEIEEEE